MAKSKGRQAPRWRARIIESEKCPVCFSKKQTQCVDSDGCVKTPCMIRLRATSEPSRPLRQQSFVQEDPPSHLDTKS